MFPTLFLLLHVAHLAADYPLQTDHQAARKADSGAKGWRANLAHAATHTATSAAALLVGSSILDLTLQLEPALAALAWITATHAVVDRRWPVAAWMRLARQTNWADHGGAAHVDQTAHTLAIAVAALYLAA